MTCTAASSCPRRRMAARQLPPHRIRDSRRAARPAAPRTTASCRSWHRARRRAWRAIYAHGGRAGPTHRRTTRPEPAGPVHGGLPDGGAADASASCGRGPACSSWRCIENLRRLAEETLQGRAGAARGRPLPRPDARPARGRRSRCPRCWTPHSSSSCCSGCASTGPSVAPLRAGSRGAPRRPGQTVEDVIRAEHQAPGHGPGLGRQLDHQPPLLRARSTGRTTSSSVSLVEQVLQRDPARGLRPAWTS